MSKVLNVSTQDIIHNIKLSCQIPVLMEAIATQKIITDAALEAGIKVESEELQQAGDNLRLAHKLVKAKDTWEWLKKHYLALDEFEEMVYNNLLARKLANHLFAQQVEQFFFQHKLDYVAAATYEVVFDDRDFALELFYALSEGEITFQEIARQYIQSPELRRAGGYQGIRYRSDFRPEIAAAVFAAHPPQIIKPIVTPKGVYLIWVEEIIQPELNEQLRQKIITDLFSAWLKQQITEMEIVPQLELDANLQPLQEMLKQA